MENSMKVIEVTILPDGRMDTINAAAYLGCSPKTLAMMRCSGTGPAYVKPGRVFYFQEELDEWVRKNHGRSTPETLLTQEG